ncbi:MAG: DUF4159 domain-containing protein [Bdellovibrionota bacterium]
MAFNNIFFNLTTAFIGGSCLFLLAVIFWFLVKSRKKNIWLPTLRIVKIDSPRLPKLKLVRPPLIPFLCFIISACGLLIFTTKPVKFIPESNKVEQPRVHLYLDLSPSISASINIDQYVAKIERALKALQGNAHISYSTSHSPQVYELSNSEKLAKKIQSLGFHRPGVRIGSSLKTTIKNIASLDVLLIFSDRDYHSWSDFNWKYFSENIEIRFVDITDSMLQERANVFIDKANFISSPTFQTMDWDVEIASVSTGMEKKGFLKVFYQKQEISNTPIIIPEKNSKINLRVSWPKTKISQKREDKEAYLLWRLEVVQGDQLKLDNEYRTPLRGLGNSVILIGEPSGEQMLEDMSKQLDVILSVMGFRVERYDHIVQPGPKVSDYPLWLLVGGAGYGVDGFCPDSLASYRQAYSSNSNKIEKKGAKIWLIPSSVASYGDLCWCYHRLLKAKDLDSVAPIFCRDVSDRNSFSAVLRSLGAKQIGGELGDSTQSLAWISKDYTSGVEVLAFTVPLQAGFDSGISHVQLPLLLNKLLGWQQLFNESTGNEGWARISDLATLYDKSINDSEFSKPSSDFVLSNVPHGESRLSVIAAEQLPPEWKFSTDSSKAIASLNKTHKDSFSLIVLIACLIMLALALELAWMVSGKIFKRNTARSFLFFILLASFAFSQRALKAEVSLNLVGYQNSTLKWGHLSQETSQRTSLSLAPSATQWSKLTEQSMDFPWIWVNSIEAISDKGVLFPQVVYWLKRGGLLIVQGSNSKEQLAHLTSKGFDLSPSARGWLPIAPEHVLMRSFYLLDSLPNCSGRVWSNFHYDGRMMILSIPYDFLSVVSDTRKLPSCENFQYSEHSVRRFINLLMVALASDYKKDQIHLPEILKRLR